MDESEYHHINGRKRSELYTNKYVSAQCYSQALGCRFLILILTPFDGFIVIILVISVS